MTDSTTDTQLVTFERQLGEHLVRGTAQKRFSQLVTDIQNELETQSDRLYDGFVMQFGWGPVFVDALGDGGFTLRIPDYQGDAANDRTTDLSPALATMIAQLWMLQTTGESPQHAEFWQDILVGPGWDDEDDFKAQRLNINVERSTGWMLIPDDWEFGEMWRKEHIQFLPAWQVIQRYPALQTALLLPTWSGVEVRNNQVSRVVEWGDEDGSERLMYEAGAR